MNIKRKVKNYVRRILESYELAKITKYIPELQNINKINKDDLEKIFNSENLRLIWEGIREEFSKLKIPSFKGGVNNGDQRAIFYLISNVKPRTVLEIGTHIGCSTVQIALAMKQYGADRLLSVDIEDVNDENNKYWEINGSTYSPKKMINMINTDKFVEFKVSDSVVFLEKCKEKFDFIFLDGNHKAKFVYREIVLASKLLNSGGAILIHDYYPNNKPIWGEKVIPGPFLAVSRLLKENNDFRIVPLGSLPWETKNGSKITSLAMLSHE
jgi:cephalosporin hydroxylase